jgi:thioredoxin
MLRLGFRNARLASPLAMLTCVRAATVGPAASTVLVRSLYARAAPPLWARLRAGERAAANLTTAADALVGPTVINTLEEFESALEDAGPKLVIVDFTATWCGPCKMIGPVFDQLAEEYRGKAVFLKVDVDENSDTAQDCGIRAMPTFQFYKGGGKLAEFAGADKAKLLELVKKHV